MIREFQPGDLEQIQRIHAAKGYEFALPDLTNPLMVVRKVLADNEDRVTMAAFGRLHINAMLFVDGALGTPEERLTNVVALQNEAMAAAGTLGLDIATTQMEGRFAERMAAMGWVKGWGEMFYRRIP